MRKARPQLESVAEEFEGALLGDERRTRRLVSVAESIASDPKASFPQAACSDAALEGTYRLLGNADVTPAQILAVHSRRAIARASDASDVLVVHDTTSFAFAGEREGLGPLRAELGVQGFFAHVSLLVSYPQRMPLGVLHYSSHVREPKPKRNRSHRARLSDPHNESQRWGAHVERCGHQLASHPNVVHVMDREADSYALLASMLSADQRFVVRLAHDRATTEPIEGTKAHVPISEVLASAPVLLVRDVELSTRKAGKTPNAKRLHPSRPNRVAKLEARSATLELLRPTPVPDTAAPRMLSINVVYVTEPSPPAGQVPIEWALVTNLPVDSSEAVGDVIDRYRGRWLVEEYFKALKTGCAIETRQLESRHALENALAVFMPIAWRLLLLRHLSRLDSNEPAAVALSELQLRVLPGLYRHYRKQDLPKSLTTTEAAYAIAAIGGHIKNNGPPGWIVLGRGLEKLLDAEVGFALATSQM
jgi:hypothetical protein